MTPLVANIFGGNGLTSSLAEALGGEVCEIETRQFPDGETYFRYLSPIETRPVILLCPFDQPDRKFLTVLFAAAAARELGAAQVGLVAPYLAYMRQDRRFQPGEAITSAYFAKSLSTWIDWLVTVDPHLHRHGSLSDIYTVPAVALPASSLISDWIQREVERPLLIGPDGESEQWVAAVARDAGAPYTVLKKVRRGDHDVEVSVPHVAKWLDRTPVLVDDIVSTARTMIETVGHLGRAGLAPPVCVAVHGIFAGSAYEDMLDAGVSRIVTTNTVIHETSEIDVTDLLAEGVRRMMG